MRKSFLTALLVGAGMLALVATSQAQNPPSTPGGPSSPMDSTKSSSAKHATGEVTSVDAKAGKLMVKTSTDEINLDVQAAGAKKSLSSIKVGDKVNVIYQDKSGTLIANSISKSSSSSKETTGASSSSDMGSSKKSH
jgi:Cu/Ag efflux protein CusF